MPGGQCIATNFLLSWSVAGAIAGLETKAIFSDLGSEKIRWIHCVGKGSREKEEAQPGERRGRR